MIRVIAFDLDDTLWHVDPVIIRAEKIVSEWLRGEVPGFDAAISEMRAVRENLIKQDPTLAHRLTELRRQVLFETLQRAGHDQPLDTANQAMEVFLEARNTVDFFEGVLDTIAGMTNDYTLGALTNGNADIHRLGLSDHFSFAFSAEEIGAPKPQPDLFHAALDHTGVRPEEMVYVGDDPVKDVDAANRVGLRTVWVKNETRPGPGDTEADAVISDIRELPKVVELLK